MKIIGRKLRLQNVKAVYDLDDDASPIPADKNRLEQVVFKRVAKGRDVIENRVVFQENAEAGLEIIEKGLPPSFWRTSRSKRRSAYDRALNSEILSENPITIMPPHPPLQEPLVNGVVVLQGPSEFKVSNVVVFPDLTQQVIKGHGRQPHFLILFFDAEHEPSRAVDLFLVAQDFPQPQEPDFPVQTVSTRG